MHRGRLLLLLGNMALLAALLGRLRPSGGHTWSDGH